jgi:hypothetical protein
MGYHRRQNDANAPTFYYPDSFPTEFPRHLPQNRWGTQLRPLFATSFPLFTLLIRAALDSDHGDHG